MELIIGGHGQGQMAYLKAQGRYEGRKTAQGGHCDPEDIFTCDIMEDFHEYVRRFYREDFMREGLVKKMIENNPDITVVTDEVGCGIVPMAQEDRVYREIHGRLCCEIASSAGRVIRVICGIGMEIK